MKIRVPEMHLACVLLLSVTVGCASHKSIYGLCAVEPNVRWEYKIDTTPMASTPQECVDKYVGDHVGAKSSHSLYEQQADHAFCEGVIVTLAQSFMREHPSTFVRKRP